MEKPTAANGAPGIVRPLAPTRRASRVLAVLWAAAIAVLLATPLPPEQEDYLPGWLARLLGPWADDVAHGALFFGMAYLLLGAIGGRRFRLGLAFVVAVAYGALTEWLQQRIAGRTASWGDLVADAIGALAGVFVAIALERVRERSRDRRGSPGVPPNAKTSAQPER